MWITANERGKIDSKKNISTSRRDDNPMFWVKSEKTISVILDFDLRKGGALIFIGKRSFWMRLQISTHLGMMRWINQEVQKCCGNTIYLILRCWKSIQTLHRTTQSVDISSWTFETSWSNSQPNFTKLNGN